MQLSEGAKRSELHPLYAEIGEAHELLHADEHPEARREVPFKRAVTDNSILSGRADFVFDDRIDECKATFSKPAFKDAQHGKPSMSHLTQLVCYMIEFGHSRGRLIYGYFELSRNGKPVRKGTATIEVSIDDEGKVLTNDTDTGYKTQDLINSILAIAEHRQSDIPAPRPAKSGFNSACTYCVNKELCDRIEAQGLSISDVKSEAIELIESKTQAVPRPNKEK